MESVSLSFIDEERKILIALNYNGNEFDIGFKYKEVLQQLTYRKELAKRYLINEDEEQRKEIKAIIDYCNNNIKLLLGL